MAPHGLPEALSLLAIALVLDAIFMGLPVLREAQRAPAGAVRALAGWCERRLDRARRSAATRLVRGAVVVALIAALAWAAGAAVEAAARHPSGARGIEVAAILCLMFQRRAFDAARAAARALAGGDRGAAEAALAVLAPRAPAGADEHALARLAIAGAARACAAGAVGVTLWYLAFGLPGLALYRAVHEARRGLADDRPGAFAVPAERLDAVLSFVPAFVAAILLSAAALFVPGGHPLRALAQAARAGEDSAVGAAAGALGLALGPGRGGWIGEGRARALPGDVRAAAALVAVAGLIHAGLLGAAFLAIQG